MEYEKTIDQAREHYVNCWSQIAVRFPKNINPQEVGFLRHYFRVQLRIAEGKTKKARRLFETLIKRPGYVAFEDKNQSILAAIDTAVKGSTRWEVKPEFKINRSNSSH
mgnify:CR=1 FL=1